MKIIENQKFDEERALYGSSELLVRNCSFDGPADGESAFKECCKIEVEDCFFNLRYPFWHDSGLKIRGCEMTELCRASLWYSEHIEITDTKMHGIKALRECRDVVIDNCDIISPEFRLVRKWDSDETQYRRKRVFHDACYRLEFFRCAVQREIFIPVHKKCCV